MVDTEVKKWKESCPGLAATVCGSNGSGRQRFPITGGTAQRVQHGRYAENNRQMLRSAKGDQAVECTNALHTIVPRRHPYLRTKTTHLVSKPAAINAVSQAIKNLSSLQVPNPHLAMNAFREYMSVSNSCIRLFRSIACTTEAS